MLLGIGKCMNLSGKSENRIKFSYALVKNSKTIGQLKSNIDETVAKMKDETVDKDFVKYEQERKAILEKNSKKDAKGKPVTRMEGRFMHFEVEDLDAHEKEINKLEKKYQKAIESQTKIDSENQKAILGLLDEEEDVVIHKVPIEFVPDDITPAVLNEIMPMIEE